MKVVVSHHKHTDVETYYLHFAVANELMTSEFVARLDAVHSEQDAKYMAERITALFADVARHAREDAISEHALKFAESFYPKPHNQDLGAHHATPDTPDPFAAFRATSDDYNRRADIRACMAALLASPMRNGIWDEDELACEALDAADAIARKLGVADAPANVTKCDVHTLEKLNAIRNAAIEWKESYKAYIDTGGAPASNRLERAARVLLEYIP